MRFLSKKELAYILLIAFLIIPVMLLRHNFAKTNLSQSQLGNELSKDILRVLPKDSVIVLTGDTVIFNTWYVHYALNERPDVLLMQLGHARQEKLFEEARDQYLDKNKDEKDGYRVIYGSLLTIQEKRPVFLSSYITPPFSNITLVPWGLVLQPLDQDKVPDEKEYLTRVKAMWKDINPPERDKLSIEERNLTTSDIPRYYSDSLARTANFVYQQYKNSDEALYFFKEALRVDPLSAKSYAGVAAIEYEVKKQCQDAEINIKKAIELNALERYNYLLLYLIYRDCYKDNIRVEGFKKYFKERFKSDIEEQFKQSSPSQ